MRLNNDKTKRNRAQSKVKHIGGGMMNKAHQLTLDGKLSHLYKCENCHQIYKPKQVEPLSFDIRIYKYCPFCGEETEYLEDIE